MERIQFKRSKKLPENTIYVASPSKWGNPFKLVGDMIYIDAGYRRKILDKWVYFSQGTIEDVIRYYEQLFDYEHEILETGSDLTYWFKHFRNLDLSELKGKNLACYCKLDAPCHADVLLRLANKEMI